MIRTSGKFLLPDGFSIAYQRWRNGGTAPILALHGWLDNSNSFSFLGEQLALNGYDVVAIDHAGHGHSSHAPFGAVLSNAHSIYTEHALRIMDSLEWTKCHVMGHSMGAIVSVCLAAAFPERVDKLVLIEGLGRVSKPASTAPKSLRHAIEMRMKTVHRTPLTSKIHDTFNDAVRSRVETVASFPGKQVLHTEAAALLVARGTRSVDQPELSELEDTSTVSGRVQFRHDPRLLLPNDIYITPEQNTAIISAVNSPTLLLTADNGWPFSSHDFIDQERHLLEKNLLSRRHLAFGSHHPQMHPASRASCATEIIQFLSNGGANSNL